MSESGARLGVSSGSPHRRLMLTSLRFLILKSSFFFISSLFCCLTKCSRSTLFLGNGGLGMGVVVVMLTSPMFVVWSAGHL